MIKKIPLVFFLTAISIAGQNLPLLSQIRSNYESFQFRNVIEQCNILLEMDTSLSKNQKIELLTMNAVSFYSLGILDSARISFIELLKVEPQHELDPVLISPKVIDYFEQTRSDYVRIKGESNDLPDPVAEPIYIDRFDYKKYGNSLVRSILLPGFGHLYASDWKEGWLFGTAGLLSLTGTVYFIIDANSKEEKYLNETDLELISKRYDDYNSSYKLRNVMIGVYAAVWLFAQLDLIYFSNDLFKRDSNLNVGLSRNQHDVYFLSFRIGL